MGTGVGGHDPPARVDAPPSGVVPPVGGGALPRAPRRVHLSRGPVGGPAPRRGPRGVARPVGAGPVTLGRVPLVSWPDWLAVAVDVLAWGLVHASSGYAAHRWPVHRLQSDGPLLRVRPAEGRVYERAGIRSWKDRLPEAGAL